MRTLNKGFTMIELVVVITILATLAAFAIPRFTALDSRARISALTALGGSLRSASALAHAQYLVTGSSPASLTMDGATVTLVNGYPDVAGIQSALQDTTGFTPTATATSVTFAKNGAPTSANCSVRYTISAAANTAPVIAAPETSGC
ncbi:MAG: type II secretion system protein [Steroidobacteraceae bacterium]|jgi:MSHA pilin protein MshA